MVLAWKRLFIALQDVSCGIAIISKRPKRISTQEAIVIPTGRNEDDLKGRQSVHNILMEHWDVAQYARRLTVSPLRVFRLLIDIKMLSHTEFLEKMFVKLSSRHLLHFCAFMEHMEVEVFILRVFGRNNGTFHFFPQKKARNNFREFLRFLRFELRSTTSVCFQTDKLALVSDIWNGFVSNIIACYRPGTRFAVNEQLFPTKTYGRFTQYVVNKPSNFEWNLAVDVQIEHMLNAVPSTAFIFLEPGG